MNLTTYFMLVALLLQLLPLLLILLLQLYLPSFCVLAFGFLKSNDAISSEKLMEAEGFFVVAPSSPLVLKLTAEDDSAKPVITRILKKLE